MQLPILSPYFFLSISTLGANDYANYPLPAAAEGNYPVFAKRAASR